MTRLPGRWRLVRVDELITSDALAINDGYRVTRKELGRSGVPFVRGGDIGDGDINVAVQDHVLLEFQDRVKTKLSQDADVAFIAKGTVGRVGYLRPGQSRVVFAPQVCYWRVLDRTVLDPRFIFYLLRSHAFQANLDAVKTHGSMVADYVSLSDQRRFRLHLPPVGEQRAIAQILGALDDKIEADRRMNETLEAMARALFKSWFVDFDPVLARAEGPQSTDLDPAMVALRPHSLQASSLGRIPEGWRGGRVAEVAALSRDSINPADFADEVFEHYSIPAFDQGLTPEVEKGVAIRSNKLLVPSGCVLLSRINPRIPRVWLPSVARSRRSVCSTEFLVALPIGRSHREFLYSLFGSQAFLEVFTTLVTGTSGSHQRVRADQMLEMEIVIPTEAMMSQFSRVVLPLLECVAQNLTDSRNLTATRDALLPKLLSGEIRVKNAEKLLDAGV